MDSYVEPLLRPLFLPPPNPSSPLPTTTRINQEGGTSCRLSSSFEERDGGGGVKQTASDRPRLHISWHITDVLPQLRRQLIRTFMKGLQRDKQRSVHEMGKCR